jgi:hypothetical protein
MALELSDNHSMNEGVDVDDVFDDEVDGNVVVEKIGFDENESLDQVVTHLRRFLLLTTDDKGMVGDNAAAATLQGICIGRSDYLLEANDGCIVSILQKGIVDSYDDNDDTTTKGRRRKCKWIKFEFNSDAFPQDSKRELRWLKTQSKIQQRIHELARKIQRALDLDELEINVDGHVKQDIEPNGDTIYHGTAIINFPKVST